MNPDQKLALLLEGQEQGVRKTCERHGISHTLYYRWLKRYKAFGMKGLEPVEKDFVPANKTTEAVEQAVLACIKKNPVFGPKAIAYELHHQRILISESAVYNIMVRHQLNTRHQRLRFSKKGSRTAQQPLSFSSLRSGEGWLFWTTPLGEFSELGPLYLYTFFDFISHIACSRIYTSLSIEYFEELLTAVAMPVAQSLRFDARYLYVSAQDSLAKKSPRLLHHGLLDVLERSSFEVALHRKTTQEDALAIEIQQQAYNALILETLFKLRKRGAQLRELQYALQDHVRDYNLNWKSHPCQMYSTPVAFHAHAIQSEVILPLWAYIHRDY